MIRTLFISLMLICMQIPAYSQKVIKIYKGLALIAMTPDDGYYADDEIDVYRETVIGEPVKVGRVRVIKFDKNRCATKIIEEDKQFHIEVGDFVLVKNGDFSYELTEGNEWKSTNIFSYTVSGLGLATIGMGFYFKNLADDKYAEYKALDHDPNDIGLYNRAAKFENRSYICYAVGSGLVTAGIIHFFLNKKWNQQPLYEQSFIPQIIPETGGVRIQLTCHFPD